MLGLTFIGMPSRLTRNLALHDFEQYFGGLLFLGMLLTNIWPHGQVNWCRVRWFISRANPS